MNKTKVEMSTKILLQYLCYVLAAADKGSFRQAAIELGVWESTISRSIRKLEDEIGIALFMRSSGGIKLTNAGGNFLSHVRAAIEWIEYAIKDAGAAGRGEVGLVRVGIISSLSSVFIAELLELYRFENPRVQIHFFENGSEEHMAEILSCKIDIAFLPGKLNKRSFEDIYLWSERLFIVLPVGHKLVAYDEVPWCELQSENFIVSHVSPGPEIHDYIIKNLAEIGFHPPVDRHSVGRDNLIKLVSFKQGLTLVSESSTNILSPEVVYRPIAGEWLPFNAVWSGQNDNPAFRRFLSMAKSLSKKYLSDNNR